MFSVLYFTGESDGKFSTTSPRFFDLVGRIFTGQFWFPVAQSLAEIEVLIIPGDPDAPSRSDPFWRDTWKWIVLSAPHPAPFRIYFESVETGSCMTYCNMICTPYVAMRVGPRAIKVVALSQIGHGADIMQLDVFLLPESEASIREALTERSLLQKVTWI